VSVLLLGEVLVVVEEELGDVVVVQQKGVATDEVVGFELGVDCLAEPPTAK
jgi:hypothetical protein